jgi:hypothetical protein
MTTVIEVQGLTKQYASRMDRAKWLERPVLPVLPPRVVHCTHSGAVTPC